MRKLLVLLVAALMTLTLLTGCGCMGCGGDDRADDGVVDGSGARGTDGVIGGDKNGTADDAMRDGRSLLDDAGNAIDDLIGGSSSAGSSNGSSTGSSNGSSAGSSGSTSGANSGK